MEVMIMDYVKFGIVGIGNMGSVHVGTIRGMSNARLTAVCDINPAAFDRIEAGFRGTIEYGRRFEKLLGECGWDCHAQAKTTPTGYNRGEL